MSRMCFSLLLVAASLSLSACSSSDKWAEKLPATVAASGVVLLDGQPVVGATVIFSPVAPGEYAAQAISASDGTFNLEAFPSKSGAVPGKYEIAVTKTIEVKTDESRPKPDLGEDEEHAARNGPEGVTWKNALPSNYESPPTSGLTATIPSEGTSALKIELKSKS